MPHTLIKVCLHFELENTKSVSFHLKFKRTDLNMKQQNFVLWFLLFWQHKQHQQNLTIHNQSCTFFLTFSLSHIHLLPLSLFFLSLSTSFSLSYHRNFISASHTHTLSLSLPQIHGSTPLSFEPALTLPERRL